MNVPRNPLRRRHFLSTATLGAVAVPQLVSAADTKPPILPDGKHFNEPAMTLPLASDADVIVCGAGPAGISYLPRKNEDESQESENNHTHWITVGCLRQCNPAG